MVYSSNILPRKIAWSRLGCIAYISQDDLRVNIRHLRCQPSDGKWTLSDEMTLLPVTEAHGGLPLVHLLWNETGSELAVLDSSGRLSIYTVTTSLNQIAGQRQATFDPDDDGNQVVGIMWLNAQRSVSLIASSTTLVGEMYMCNFKAYVSIQGPRLSPSCQVEWPLGLFAFSPTSCWPFSSCKQAIFDLRNEVRSYSACVPESG